MSDNWYVSGPLTVAGEISLQSPDTGIHSLRFKRTDEEKRTHEWAFWHMNKDYRKNALEIWEYKTDRSGKSCDGDPADGAMCSFRLAISEGGNVGIGTPTPGGKLDVQGDIRAGNSDIYFTKTDHEHSGIGNTTGYAAIENASNFDALMILGRTGTDNKRRVRLWDFLEVNGPLNVTADLIVGAGGNATMRTRHIEGKSGQSDDADVLYLNWESGKDVQIGESSRPSNLGVTGHIALMGKQAIHGYDSWLRLNEGGSFTSGVHTPKLFYPGSLNVGGRQQGQDPGWGNAWFSGNIVVDGTFSWGGDKSDSGYIILGTLQICWGSLTADVPVHQNEIDVGFPKPFRTNPVVTISLNDPGYGTFDLKGGVGANAVRTSGFQILFKANERRSPRALTFSWIAIGKA